MRARRRAALADAYLDVVNFAEENPSRLVQAFFYTHPPIKERLKAAEQSAIS